LSERASGYHQPHVNDLKTEGQILNNQLSSQNPEQIFKLLEPAIGEGATGVVYKALVKQTKKVVAVKKMKVSQNNLTQTVKEIKIMKDLKSDYTLKYYGCYKEADCDIIWIVMEYCDGGSVQDIIDAKEEDNKSSDHSEGCLTSVQIAAITSQVLKALYYLHSLRMIHRDVKSGNILINSRGQAKLADFGISAKQVADKQFTTIGSSYWMAPETIKGGGYDNKADIWSLGITLLEMAEGLPPLIDVEPHKAALRIVNEPPPTLINPEIWDPKFVDFIKQCLTKNPHRRPSAAELLRHEFMVHTKPESILELIPHLTEKKRRKKKKETLEEGELLRVYFKNNEYKSIMVALHATTEDVCKRCSEQVKLAAPASDYALYFVEDGDTDGGKKLGNYDLPCTILHKKNKKMNKKKKNPFAKESFRFEYRLSD